MARAVNFVWNYCNETSNKAIRDGRRWLSEFDLNNLTKGCSKELGISSTTIQEVRGEYASRRKKARKIKLNWRSYKRSLGWIPIRADGFKLENDCIIYGKHIFRFWKSREAIGKIKTANFSQDSKGHWYINIQCEVDKLILEKTGREIGIDMGLKTIASCSNGIKYDRENITKKYEQKLAMAQRAHKKKLVKTINTKIANSRKDWNHKTTTEIINNNDTIFVGDVNSSKLTKTKLAKSVNDAGWYQFKSLLAYKAIRFGREYKEVKERFSTVTCHVCFNKTAIGGLSNLGVREWKCEFCGTVHDRDTNAARNILRFGHESPKGILLLSA
jgi:IS605 OrfB family transposase